MVDEKMTRRLKGRRKGVYEKRVQNIRQESSQKDGTYFV